MTGPLLLYPSIEFWSLQKLSRRNSKAFRRTCLLLRYTHSQSGRAIRSQLFDSSLADGTWGFNYQLCAGCMTHLGRRETLNERKPASLPNVNSIKLAWHTPIAWS
ncbi:hypothetical protein ABKN59_008256 [Abortiporus biennis]